MVVSAVGAVRGVMPGSAGLMAVVVIPVTVVVRGLPVMVVLVRPGWLGLMVVPAGMAAVVGVRGRRGTPITPVSRALVAVGVWPALSVVPVLAPVAVVLAAAVVMVRRARRCLPVVLVVWVVGVVPVLFGSGRAMVVPAVPGVMVAPGSWVLPVVWGPGRRGSRGPVVVPGVTAVPVVVAARWAMAVPVV